MFHIFSDDSRDAIKNFLKSHTMAVIATVDKEGQPSTSTIFYALTSNDELFFITKLQTAKSENLKANNKTALTLLDREKPIALNMIGSAEEITDIHARDEALQTIFKLSYEKLHDFAPIIKLHKGSFVAFRFHPKEGKMTDFTKPMGQVKEDSSKF